MNVGSLTQSEMRDIILGVEITPPSVQRQQIAELEKATEASNVAHRTAVATKTVNVHGETIVVNTMSTYEQSVFESRTEWRARALHATSLYHRANNVFVSADDLVNTEYTYVLPTNLANLFIKMGDFRAVVGVFIYGSSSADNPKIKEIRAMVVPPQMGNADSVKFPAQIPKHEELNDLEALGYMRTVCRENDHDFGVSDALMQTKFLIDNRTWNPDSVVVVSCKFTPGSSTFSSTRLTAAGFLWAKTQLKETKQVDSESFQESHLDRVPLVVSEVYQGFCMVPHDDVWNYNFQGIRFRDSLKYEVSFGNPKSFYDEAHRVIHFQAFTQLEGEDQDHLESGGLDLAIPVV